MCEETGKAVSIAGVGEFGESLIDGGWGIIGHGEGNYGAQIIE